MSTMGVRFPGSLHEKATELAKREGVSIHQSMTTAFAEQLSALLTEEYVEERVR